MSGLYLIVQRQPQHKTPLYKYAFCSLSNIMSSWCQYEALKYVSFPTQVKERLHPIVVIIISLADLHFMYYCFLLGPG